MCVCVTKIQGYITWFRGSKLYPRNSPGLERHMSPPEASRVFTDSGSSCNLRTTPTPMPTALRQKEQENVLGTEVA